MIKHIMFLSMLLLIALTTNAQENTSDLSTDNSAANTPARPFWVSAGIGLRVMRTTPGTIHTRFTDESIDRGLFDETTEVKSSYPRMGFNLEMGFTQNIGLSHTIFLEGGAGKNWSSFCGYAVGWEIPLGAYKSTSIVPGFNVMHGAANLRLGQMDLVGEYTQVNDKVFFDNVYVNLKQNVFAYGPKLDLNFLTSNKDGITISAAYNFGVVMGKPKLRFSAAGSEDIEGEDNTAIVKLPDSSANVTFNDNELTKLPYKGGLRITIAYTWTPKW